MTARVKGASAGGTRPSGGGGAGAGDPGVWLREVEIRGDEFPRRDAYPFNLPLLQRRQVLRFDQSVSFFVGENGSGKSTLIDAIARRCGLYMWAAAKRRGAPAVSWRSAASADSRAGLSDYVHVTVARGPVRGGVFSAESFREWAEFLDDLSQIDPGHAKYHGGVDLTQRSRGEGLLAYFRGRYQIPGLYFLDEPEAALSPASQIDLLRLLAEYRERGHAQFILATHSPILMALPGAQVFGFGSTAIEETRYEETAHYQLYRDFMADPAAFLSEAGAWADGFGSSPDDAGTPPAGSAAAPGDQAAPPSDSALSDTSSPS
jgi:predicted ATPase